MNTAIRVLIVDDEERFRKTTATILEKRGFHVEAVGSGIEAINKIKDDRADIVILDIKMPGMDGNEVFREIKKINPEISVIMLTGHKTHKSAKEGLADGVFDYLTKPCSIDVLTRKIKEAYNKGVSLTEKEPLVKHIMVPLSSFSTIQEDRVISEAVGILFASFSKSSDNPTIQETAHQSILVMDAKENVLGMITINDLIISLQPQYMSLLKKRPVMADSIHLEPPNYLGMFTIMTRDLANKTVSEIMSDAPPVIDSYANLMEASSRFLDLGVRRLLVMESGKITGVVREQDLFYEMANIMGKK